MKITETIGVRPLRSMHFKKVTAVGLFACFALAVNAAPLSRSNTKNVSCQFWQSLVDPTVKRPPITPTPDENDPMVVQDAIGCLLELQGKTNRGNFSGATRFDISDAFDPATVEVGALYYVSCLFTGKRDFTSAVALRDSNGKYNTPKSVKIAYEKYRDWYKKVKELGVTKAREMKLDPLQGSNVHWY